MKHESVASKPDGSTLKSWNHGESKDRAKEGEERKKEAMLFQMEQYNRETMGQFIKFKEAEDAASVEEGKPVYF